jgi:thioredoxin-like negative regulator of GroEL
MKTIRLFIICVVGVLLCCSNGSAAPTDSFTTSSNEVWAVFDRFVSEKHDLARTIAKKHNIEMPPRAEEFFAVAQKRDWNTSTNLFFAIEADARKETSEIPGKPSHLWGAIHDTYGVLEVFHWMNPKFAKMFGEEIVQSIPAGSIYFGGTDGGRFLVSAFSKSHSKGQPFYTLTQNALADPSYLGYVADMYGDKIHVADTNDYQKCFDDYKADAKKRLLHDKAHPEEPHQILPGEDVHPDANGEVQVSGAISVMAVSARVAKTIFEKNPTKEFYVEESYPLDWMFPHLTPSGFIIKVNRDEEPELTKDVLKQDHEFWSKASARLVGDWITYDTPVKDLTDFAERVFLRHDYGGFRGDEDFIRDWAAQTAFSKLRSSIAGVYGWRLGMPPSGGTMPQKFIASGDNRALIEREADFAFKQAFAFCPTSPEAVFRYVQLLVNMRRVNDALLIAETALKLDPKNSQFEYLIKNLNNIRVQSGLGQTPDQLKAEVAELEKENKPGSTNFMQQIRLAQKLIQIGENERAYEVMDGILANPHATPVMVKTVASAYDQLKQPARLQNALEAWVRLEPESPESWFDLAASHVMLGQNAQTIDCLKKMLELNLKRLAQDPKATDLRTTLVKDPRFFKLRGTPEFNALVTPE